MHEIDITQVIIKEKTYIILTKIYFEDNKKKFKEYAIETAVETN